MGPTGGLTQAMRPPPRGPAAAGAAHPAPPLGAGEITSVPGYRGELRSRHFGGYITVGEAPGRSLYFYLVESERDAAADPVVLWLNGGPGCSSFDGFVYEHGPFLFSRGEGPGGRAVELRDNPASWSKAATVIYLDSPAGVGLSFTAGAASYQTNDTATAADSAAFLREFFRQHPHLQRNDFFISGESYAGIYVPMLAAAVVEGNRRREEPHIHLKGYLVGNGCTDPRYDGNAQVPFAAGKSLIPQTLWGATAAACGGKFYDPEPGSRCEGLLRRVDFELSGLNVYNVLEDCHGPGPGGPLGGEQGRGGGQRAMQHVLRTHRDWPVTGVVRPGARVLNWAQLVGHNPPCTQTSEADAWLNDPDVREAIHAAPLEEAGPWTICSDKIFYTSDGGSMLPIHRRLTRRAGLRALIYSGDHDMAVPHTGSEAWTAAIHEGGGGEDGKGGGEVSSPWQPWHTSSSPPQVAGYTVSYSTGLTYATVKGAGHMVPSTRPFEALTMFERFIRGEPLEGGA